MKELKDTLNEALLKYIVPETIKFNDIKGILAQYPDYPSQFDFEDDDYNGPGDEPIRLIFVCNGNKKKLKNYFKKNTYMDFSNYDTDRLVRETVTFYTQGVAAYDNAIWICDRSEGISNTSLEYVINRQFRTLSFIPDENKTIKYYIVK